MTSHPPTDEAPASRAAPDEDAPALARLAAGERGAFDVLASKYRAPSSGSSTAT